MDGHQHINQDLHRAFLHHNISLEQNVPQICIRNHGSGVSIRHRANHQSFLELPPAFKGLGPYTTRDLRDYFAHLPWFYRLQHGHRLYHHSPTDANGLEAADGQTQKDRAHDHFCSWPHVRPSIYTSRNYKADRKKYSVCVVSMIRLVLYMHINKLDHSLYSVAGVDIVTLLEPLLGIIVACLPLFPPALKKVVDHMSKTNPETRNVLSSSMARLRMKRSKSSAFHSLGDSFPLTDLEAKGTHNHITGSSGKPDGMFEGDGNPDGFRNPPQSSILVESDLEVRSDEAKHLGGKLAV